MKIKFTLAAFAATALVASAATTLTNSGVTTTSQGSYYGVAARLNDANWNVSGDPLASTVQLTSMTLYRGASGGSNTNAASFLNVYDGTTFVGSSTNSVNIQALPLIDQTAVFTFENLTIQSATTYQFRLSATNTAGGTAHIARLRMVQPANLANGVALNSGYNGQDTGFDPKYSITVIPEPSAAALLGLGGLALILRRRK